jgi:ABC-type polar amino acid transport system ATPase subunit
MINIRGLHKKYGERSVLAGLDAEVEAGAIVAVVGASGSGKSTLLRCLNALEPFDSGRIEIAGHELTPGLGERELNRLRADVGLVFQDYQLFPHLSALENVSLSPRVVGKLSHAESERLGQRWLERVGIGDRAAARPSELSGGQKQRVALARALAQGVRVLLLDEPTSALDPETRDEVRRVLADVVRGPRDGRDARPLTLMIVTHDLSLASEIADELWVLDEGTLAERGAPHALVTAPQSRVAREYFSRLLAN